MAIQEIQPKRVRTVATSVAFAGMAIGSVGFGGHIDTDQKSPSPVGNINSFSNIDINSVHTQDNGYADVAAQMDAINAKTAVTVVISEKGESLTQATAKATGKSVEEAYKILEKNGLAHNDLVYVHDQFNVNLSDEVTTADTNVAPDITHAQTQAQSESKSVNQAPAVAATTNVNKSESIVQAPATQTPDIPKPTATVVATSTNEPTATTARAAVTSTAASKSNEKVLPSPTVKISSTSTSVPGSGSATVVTSSEQNLTSTGCIKTDLKGNFDWAGDSNKHLINDPTTFHLQNVGTNADCPNTVWAHGFATNDAPKLADGITDNPEWLKNQRPIGSKSYNIELGAQDQRESFDIPDISECYAQVDLVRTSEVRVPPLYNESDLSMIDWGLWENPKCKVTPTSTASNTATPVITFTATATATNTPLAECIVTDVKGELNDLEDSNHLTGRNVTGKVSNIAKNPACPDDIYIHMYGSMQKPTGTGQNIGLNIESQKGNHILTKEINVPENTIDMPIEITIPQNKFCTVQVDLTRDGEIKDEPRYIDNDFLLFVDDENCNPKTPTPTSTNTATSTATFTPTSTRTATPTNTPELTATNTATNTATVTVTNTPVPTESRIITLPHTGTGPNNPEGQSNTMWYALAGVAGVGLASETIRRKFGSIKHSVGSLFAPAPVDMGPSQFEQRLMALRYSNSNKGEEKEFVSK